VSPKLQFLISIFIAAHLIAYGLSGTMGFSYATLFFGSLVILGMFGFFLWRWSGSKRTSTYRREMKQAIAEIKGLSLENAKKRAYLLLGESNKFKCVMARSTQDLSADLAASLQEFFSIYESVETVAGEAKLSRDAIGQSEYNEGFLRIGTNLDFTEIAVRPMEDDVYEIDGSEVSQEDLRSSQLPSIFHWVIVTSEVLYGGNEH
jgi:hypothetical protein